MKLVFQGFEHNMILNRGAINVLRIEDRSLYARCCLSISQGFADGVPEPASFYDDNGRELKPKDCLTFAGDLLSLDLNGREISAKATKKIVQMLIDKQEITTRMESQNYAIEDLFAESFLQLSGDYVFNVDWDVGKYLKAFGFGVDASDSVSLYQKACHYLRIAADLFPDNVIVFINLNTFLSEDEYYSFCRCAAAEELIILSCEVGNSSDFLDLENGIFIDADYLDC